MASTDEKLDAILALLKSSQRPTFDFWRMPKVVSCTGLSKSTIWIMAKAGTFPEPRQIGAQAVAWRSTDVLEWMASCPVVEKGDGE